MFVNRSFVSTLLQQAQSRGLASTLQPRFPCSKRLEIGVWFGAAVILSSSRLSTYNLPHCCQCCYTAHGTPMDHPWVTHGPFLGQPWITTHEGPMKCPPWEVPTVGTSTYVCAEFGHRHTNLP